MSYGTYPSSKFAAITPSDTAKIPTYQGSDDSVGVSRCRALYVGSAGDVKIKNDAGTAVVFAAVPAGDIIPASTDFVYATDTTASSIVALY